MIRLRGLNDDDLVWATNENPAYAEKAEAKMFNKYTEEVRFTQRYSTNGYRMIMLYSFRSFFFGRASDVHRKEYAHRMTGHGGYLPQYDRMNDDKRLGWFLNLESELVINNEDREKIKKQKLEAEKTELKKKVNEIDEMKKQ